MNMAIFLLVAAVMAPSDADANEQRFNDAVAEHQRYIAIHTKWLGIHQSDAREHVPAKGCLVIDPHKNGMWIEQDAHVDPRDTKPLPHGFDWSAYHITRQGVTEITFPVRLGRPRTKLQDENDSEVIWIVGMSKNNSWHCSFSASPDAGQGFTIGSGSRIMSITGHMPMAIPALEPAPLQESILVPNSRDAVKWADTIKNKWLSITVVRSPATAP